MEESTLKYVMLANIKGLGPASQEKIVRACGGIRNSFMLQSEELMGTDLEKEVGKHKMQLFLEGRENGELRERAEKTLSDAQEKGIRIVTREDDDYPRRFINVPDMPVVLYVKGDLRVNDYGYSAGIIGARRCTHEGKSKAISCAEKVVSSGGMVVSGMAKGIDSYSQTAAILAGGYTVAVLGNGPDICYPKEHQSLYDKIAEKGCIISEYPPEATPRTYMFPRRNRLIAALSDEVYVIDAGRNSGTETTVEDCVKYERRVVRLRGEM